LYENDIEMKNTKAAILKLYSGKTIHGVVIEQTIEKESIAFIRHSDISKVGTQAIHQLLQLIPVSQIKELDFCVK
jgi:hypothetical protein